MHKTRPRGEARGGRCGSPRRARPGGATQIHAEPRRKTAGECGAGGAGGSADPGVRESGAPRDSAQFPGGECTGGKPKGDGARDRRGGEGGPERRGTRGGTRAGPWGGGGENATVGPPNPGGGVAEPY